jgi:glycosyltransferase involved in cell wall biosynthesis
MRIAFATLSDAEFRVDSPYQIPLGGSESALCYLAEALAQQGHEVFLLNNVYEPAVSRDVQCLYAEPRVVKTLPPLDAFVIQNSTGWANAVRPLLAPTTRVVLWTQIGHDQLAMRVLRDPRERAAYDGIAFVSEWQRGQYVKHCGVDPQCSAILRNAIAPAFSGLFRDDTSVVGQKTKPPSLAYTSTPYRGLGVLLDVLPDIRRAVPGTTLKVFSSMRIYQVADAADEAEFGHLYRKCRDMEGVEHVGVVPQPVLANELLSVALLAYPSTFAETSCIAVLEAMAAGCCVVTSDLAALPETTAGFARLVSMPGVADADYRRNFVDATVEVLKQFTGSSADDVETHLRRQVNYVNESSTWTVRAHQWVEWLTALLSRTA